MKNQVICMSFDGEFKRERPEFESIEDAWEYANDLGSKWYFYPFYFVVRGQTIRAAGYGLEVMENRRIKTVAGIFNAASKQPEAEDMDVDSFVQFLTV